MNINTKIKSVLLSAIIVFAAFLSSCGAESNACAADKLENIVCEFDLEGVGSIYTSEDEENTLSGEMLSSLFALGGNVSSFKHVVSCAAFFKRDFYGGEIIVFEMTDVSRTEEIISMFRRRAKKKENAEVVCRGNYIYLICLENAKEISAFVKKNG